MGTEQQTQTREESARAKRELRTGACVAVACSDRCAAFAYDRHEDGFDICVCGHTQWAHSKGEATE